MYDLEVLYGPGRPSGVENRLSVHIAAQLDHLTIVILFHDGHSAERSNPSVRSGGDLDSHESPIARRSELLHSIACSLCEAQSIDPELCSFGGRAFVEPAYESEVDQMVLHAHLGVETTLLRHVAEAPSDLLSDLLSAPANFSRARFEHAQNDAHGRGLAGAIGSDEAQHLAVLNDKRQTVERRDVPV